MSLQWDLTDIQDYQELCWLDNPNEDHSPDEAYMLNPVTEAIIQLLGLVGITKVTPKNYKEAAKRFAELEVLGITYELPTNPREDEVYNHIGLSVISDEQLDNKKWGNKLRTIIRQQAQGLIDNAKN